MNTNTCERQRVTTAEVPKRSEGHADVAARTGRRPSRTVVLCGLAVALAASLIACTDADQAKRAVEAQGLKDVKITGYRWFGCGDSKNSSDTYHTGFEATGLNGQHVSGVVCSGILKGATVRYD